MSHYVYLYTCPIKNEPIYVGKGKGTRAWSHLKRKDIHHQFTQRLKLIEMNNLHPIIEIVMDGLTDDESKALEVHLIAKYGRHDLGKGPLLNKTDGGDGAPNPSIDDRINNAMRRMNKPSGMKGRQQSDHAKLMASRTHKGVPKSIESNQKRSESLRAFNRPKTCCSICGAGPMTLPCLSRWHNTNCKHMNK